MSLRANKSIILAGFMLVLATLGLSTEPSWAESTLEKIKRTGIFLAGVRPDYAPYGSLDNNGNPIGFGPELSKIFADKLGVHVKYVLVTSAARIPMLQNGTIDADVGLTTPTKQRNEQIDFTTPYVWDSMVLVVKKGSSLKLQDYGAPKKISTTQGSATIDYIKQKLPTAQFITFQDDNDVALALLQGKVDAAGSNLFSAQQIVAKHPDYVVSETFALDPIAIGVHQDDSKWLNWLNFTMQEMWLTGEYQSLYEKWFGAKPEWQIWSAYRLQPGIEKK
jgi:polar amino acid transport system substrate-binding protein